MSFETAETAIAEHPASTPFRAALRAPAPEAASRRSRWVCKGEARCPPRARGHRPSTVPTRDAGVGRVRTPRRRADGRPARRLACLWSSRLLVWIAGSGAVAVLGFGPVRHAFDPPGVTRGFGWLGDVLAAPVARWDAAWYLVIAHYGYRPEFGAFTAPRDAFFPLYPLGLRALSDVGLAPVIAGVACLSALRGVSTAARLRRSKSPVCAALYEAARSSRRGHGCA